MYSREEFLKHSTQQVLDSLGHNKKADKDFYNQLESMFYRNYKELYQVGELVFTPTNLLEEHNPLTFIDKLPQGGRIGCQGVAGAYSHMGAMALFQSGEIKFFDQFQQVTREVMAGNLDFGILPIENSTAGTVEEVVEAISKAGCYIVYKFPIIIQHSLAASLGTTLDSVKEVYSHSQALRQCKGYLEGKGYKGVAVTNTAVAAQKMNQEQKKDQACICSKLGAELYNLEILEENIQDYKENYTRFVCIGAKALVLPQANCVSIALSFPNQPGALGQLLTRFTALNLDLSHIQSMPIGGSDFLVRFHLDFTGHLGDLGVKNFLGHLYNEYKDFQFLGNYPVL